MVVVDRTGAFTHSGLALVEVYFGSKHPRPSYISEVLAEVVPKFLERQLLTTEQNINIANLQSSPKSIIVFDTTSPTSNSLLESPQNAAF